jgi:hypothetical protein
MSPALEEQENVSLTRPDQRPPTFGLTLVAKPNGPSAHDLLRNMREAWSVVAGWGRWSDQEPRDWPENKEVLAAVPNRLRRRLEQLAEGELESWTDDLHDRDWIWWSGAVVGDWVKLDVESFSMPVSLQPLRALVDWSGGTVVAQQDWVPSDRVCA